MPKAPLVNVREGFFPIGGGTKAKTPRKNGKKGFSLIAALLVMLIVTLTVAVMGTIFVKEQQIATGVKTYKTSKEAAEALAQAVIEAISDPKNNGNVPTKGCRDSSGNPCTLGCSASDCKCLIDWDADPTLQKIKEAVEKSLGAEPVGYILSNCTASDGSRVYTIEVTANSTSGAHTTVYFIYQFQP